MGVKGVVIDQFAERPLAIADGSRQLVEIVRDPI